MNYFFIFTGNIHLQQRTMFEDMSIWIIIIIAVIIIAFMYMNNGNGKKAEQKADEEALPIGEGVESVEEGVVMIPQPLPTPK